MLVHRVTFMNHSKMNADERRYVPPSRPYEPPEHREGVKYSTSNEPCEVLAGGNSVRQAAMPVACG
jgi:hypothetical protein